MPAGDVALRLATEGDREPIRALIAATFPENPKARADIIDWQYWSNPFGTARSWVADDDGRIVGHYAGIALPATLGGRAATIAQGVDAALASTHRGQGLFERLARAVYDDCGAVGMPLTYCLPNDNSLGGATRAGMHLVGTARVLVAPIDDGWLAGRFRLPRRVAMLVRAGFRVPSGGSADIVDAPPADIDELWAEVASRYGHGLARTAAWWRWRYEQRPERPYLFAEARTRGRLTGAAAAVVRDDLGGRFLCVLELMSSDRRSGRDLVAALARAAGKLGAVGLATTGLSGTWQYDTARAARLVPLPRRLQPQPIHVGLVDNDNAMADSVGRMRWSLAWGDLDHI